MGNQLGYLKSEQLDALELNESPDVSTSTSNGNFLFSPRHYHRTRRLYQPSPADDIVIIGDENLSLSGFNVSSNFPPLVDCPPPLSLANEVSDSILTVSIFKMHGLGIQKSFIDYLSEQNNAFEKIQQGELAKAREILVDNLGVSLENFDDVKKSIQSRASSPSENENQANLLLQP